MTTLIYQPGPAVGIGHLVVGISDWHAIAAKIGATFAISLRNTIFSSPGAENEFLHDYFDFSGQNPFSAGSPCIDKAIASSVGPFLIIGSSGRHPAVRESFPALRDCRLLDCVADKDELSLEYMARFDIVYVDSQLPQPSMIRRIEGIAPCLSLSKDLLQSVRSATGHDPYIVVHVRHGNGEPLHGRAEGGSSEFDSFLNMLSLEALNIGEETGIRRFFVLADNFDAKAQVAACIGGQTLNLGELPVQRFQQFFAVPPSKARLRLKAMMLDFAVLAQAARVIAGPSLFPLAAGRLFPHLPVCIFNNDVGQGKALGPYWRDYFGSSA